MSLKGSQTEKEYGLARMLLDVGCERNKLQIDLAYAKQAMGTAISNCGAPNASDACRNAIKTLSECLKELNE